MSAATETLRRRIAAESPGFYDTFDALTDPEHPNHADAKEWADDYDPDIIDELPIKYALARIANRRNATVDQDDPAESRQLISSTLLRSLTGRLPPCPRYLSTAAGRRPESLALSRRVGRTPPSFLFLTRALHPCRTVVFDCPSNFKDDDSAWYDFDA